MLASGWKFLYNLILRFLLVNKDRIMESDDLGILEIVKHYTQHSTKFISDKEIDMNVKIDWRLLILEAKSSSKGDQR